MELWLLLGSGLWKSGVRLVLIVLYGSPPLEDNPVLVYHWLNSYSDGFRE